MTHDRLTNALIILAIIAAGLGIIASFVVFFPMGSEPVTIRPSDQGVNASGTTPAPNNASSTATSTPPTPAPGQYMSEYTYPYPLTWGDGNEQFAITGASLQDGTLTLTLSIKTGLTAECVPLNLRLVKDEAGALQAPVATQFQFPDTGGCEGRTNQTYSEPVTFSVDPSRAPYLLMTGGSASLYFTVATTTQNGIQITLPANSG